MKIFQYLIVVSFLICWNVFYSQTNTITINAKLNVETNEITVNQKTIFYNKTESILNAVYFHNWANAYNDKKTPLAKRFVENYSKSFQFTTEKNRGNSTIQQVQINNKSVAFEIPAKNPDFLKIPLTNFLKPGDSVTIIANYTVKLPNAKFTNYGFDKFEYNLRYWYLAPAIFDGGWKLYNNLDLDDLYVDFTNYTINFVVPTNYFLTSDLDASFFVNAGSSTYFLSGNHRLDITINISKIPQFKIINSKPLQIITNLGTNEISGEFQENLVDRELQFIETYLGKLPQQKLLVTQAEYNKNPVYGFNQLPSFIAPHSSTFEWDIKMFKTLTHNYISNLFLFNQRKDVWLVDGLQIYLMMKYVEKYYPKTTAIGNLSKVWGIKGLNLAKVSFNEKYLYVYQFAARKNLDQPLTTPTDSLSVFNKKIVNKYKAGLGLKYLTKYIGDSTFNASLHKFCREYSNKKTSSSDFLNKINTSKDISWFTNSYLHTDKKIDYTLSKIKQNNDTLEVTIKNKRKFNAPVELYGIEDTIVKFKKWITDVDSVKTVKIEKNGFKKLSINYENNFPEINLKNNWKNVQTKILNRPLQIRFLKDIENPYYNQIFYIPLLKYNYYDGAIIGLALSNKTILDKNFTYKLTPSYSTTSKSLSGTYFAKYQFLPEDKKINKFEVGLFGSYFHYDKNLKYSTFSPYAFIEFKRKSLRDISSKVLVASFTSVNRQKSPLILQNPETLNYNVFNLSFGYSSPGIITDIRFGSGIQIAKNFSKVSITGHYRKLTDANRQLDFRVYAGAFLKNNTTSTFFDFALDRPTDYLFQYEYLGRSETSGFLSQQIIISEGGFKSNLPISFANQWLTTANVSYGIWRWFEVYGDIGLVKNKNQQAYFAHESGIRFNFIQDILGVYFPVHSNLGLEINQANYASKIRFVLVINPKQIYNYLRRGFY